MTRSAQRTLMLAGTLAIAIGAAAAASPKTARDLGHVRAALADTLTGCLQKGDQAGTYKLTSKDGKTYAVVGQKATLDGHVGHTVRLAGSQGSSSGGAVSSDKDTAMGKMGDSSMKGADKTSSTPAFLATGLAMVSPSCQ